MKKLLTLLLSLFLLSSSSVFADDISDFTIEGISVGDSLLDYMTEEEILEEIERNKNDYYYLNEPNKYADIYLYKNLKTYGAIVSLIKNNSTNQYVSIKNEKYTILSLRGLIDFTEDFDSCIVKRDEVVEVLSNMFPDVQKTEWNVEHLFDPSGDSIIDGFFFEFNSGAIAKVFCIDWEKNFRIKNNVNDVLTVELGSKETKSWLNDY